MCSRYTDNNGGSGGAVSTAYLPISFLGVNYSQRNVGRTLVVSIVICMQFVNTIVTIVTIIQCYNDYWLQRIISRLAILSAQDVCKLFKLGEEQLCMVMVYISVSSMKKMFGKEVLGSDVQNSLIPQKRCGLLC